MTPSHFLLVAALTLGACGGTTCPTTCHRMYGETECDAAADEPIDIETLINGCIEVCEDALQISGSVDKSAREFDPTIRAPTTQGYELANEAEAAAWIDCVWSFDDQECPTSLQDRYCVWVF